MDWIRF